MQCRTPHGVRGLKFPVVLAFASVDRRTPHGVRGLKYHYVAYGDARHLVAPLTGCVD